ncbi:ArsC/Spx/MgsR family protein [Frigidibacter sp. MR17.14]|uniref:arsenate reductase family protein n=1 Tax=Frigidibacter sp. MR17.14 TaxID=3126509 RepID=UPI003012E73B
MILYGIPTCDTCRKARAALQAEGAEVSFRDLRADPLTAAERAEFLAAFGDKLVNRASTTWRSLSEDERAQDPDALLAAHPTLMKRPVVRSGALLTLGWSAATLDRLLASR